MDKPATLSNSAIYFIALISGFVILSLEILAFRMLAPYFGNSVFVSGSVITIILIFLSLGYALGGFLADRRPPEKLLIGVFGSSTVYLLLVLIVYRRALESMSGLATIPGALTAVAGLFGFPVLILSFVSPLLIKMHSLRSGVGVSAGNVYAVSTLGSILGSVLTTFAMIPFAGVQISLYINLALLLLPLFFLKKSLSTVLAAGLLMLLPRLSYTEAKTVYFRESPYNTIFVVELNGMKYLRLNQNRGMHSSSLYPDFTTGLIPDDYLIGPKLVPVKSVLILGGGGGTSAEQFRHFYNPETIDMVEIDSQVSATSKVLGFRLDGVNIIHEDARRFIRQNKKEYDMIEVDIFGGSIYIPDYVATREFFRELHDSLSENGLLMMNIIDTRSQFGLSIADTLASVFPEVYGLNGRVLTAFKTVKDLKMPGFEKHVSSGRILTDDRSDLDWMIYRYVSAKKNER